MFGSNMVTTSNKKADELVEVINDYIEDGKKTPKTKLSKLIAPLKSYDYFNKK